MFPLNIILLIISISNFVISSQDLNDDSVIVDIAEGTLKGRSVTTGAGVSYYSFQGIPYAESPIGELRFKAPQPPLSWEGVRDATTEGNECPQLNIRSLTDIVGDEDCLYLNVYTTQLPTDMESPNLSVMVWIHGGAFFVGSGNIGLYGAEYLLSTGDLVLVTINYRLGVLGFLGLDHPDVSKNNGLKDQVAALKWVQRNIGKFGGNPGDVTIFGESAGAVSVHHQLLSPLSEGLFHKAISQSGSVLDWWAYIDPKTAHERALSFGEVLSYNTNDISDLLDSFRKTDSSVLVNAQISFPLPVSLLEILSQWLEFCPTMEDGDEEAFINDSPVNLIKAGKFHQVPYITGANSAEGKAFSTDVLTNSSLWPYYEENFEKFFVPKEIGLEDGSPESLEIAARIRETYFGNQSLSDDVLEQFVDLETDFLFDSGIHRAINLQLLKSDSPVYTYIFSYVGNISSSSTHAYPFPGAGHGDDVAYLFNQSLTILDKNSADAQVVQHMTKLWTNFAKTGNPTLDMDVSWTPLNDESQTYINIDAELTIENYNEFKPEKMAFWSDLFKNIDET